MKMIFSPPELGRKENLIVFPVTGLSPGVYLQFETFLIRHKYIPPAYTHQPIFYEHGTSSRDENEEDEETCTW